MKKVACGSFVKRQTKESGYSYFDGSWAFLEMIVEALMHRHEHPFSWETTDIVKPGYRDGVILVDMGRFSSLFRSAIVNLDYEYIEDFKLNASYAPRRAGEAAFIHVSAKAEKQVAKFAQVVLYRWDVLAENNERETEAEWEIVAIKARVTEEEEPMHPVTMARNFLHLPGGTQGNFSAEDFAKSIVYWSQHCLVSAKPKWYKRITNWWRT